MPRIVLLFALLGVGAAGHFGPATPSSGRVVVSPDSMHGWAYYDDQAGVVCTTSAACRMVSGPAQPPVGAGSAELADSMSTDGKALVLAAYQGMRLDQITDLHYSTYRQTADAGNNLAISLQFNVDYDLTDAARGYQGRLVYEPYQGSGGNVPQTTWQEWDAQAGKWWGTRALVSVNNESVVNPCVQASPCTWSQMLAAFANIGIHATYGAVVLKAGSGWPGFRGNVDRLNIGILGVLTTYDFEPSPSAPPVPCRTNDGFVRDFLSWTSHTVRDTSGYAQESRGTASLPYLPSASAALVVDDATCTAMAIRFASVVPNRNPASPGPLIIVAVDSAYFVATDLAGGVSTVKVRLPNGTAGYNTGGFIERDAITINRTTGAVALWLYLALSPFSRPYP